MNYKEMSEEYIAQYKKLSFYIKNLKLQLNKDSSNIDYDLHKRITTLYTMCLELKHVGEYLEKVCSKRDI